MRLETRFTLNPVGQGLFYDGRIGNLGFVYDCGTSSEKTHLDQAIDQFARGSSARQMKKESKASLSLLVVSHFHSDHISGLDRLLNLATFDYVVLPYLSPTERLVLALETLDEDPWYYECLGDPIQYLSDLALETLDEDPWYYECLGDPIQYLSDRNPGGKLLLITSGKPGEDGDSPYDRETNPSNEPALDDESIRLPNDKDSEKEIAKGDPDWLGRLPLKVKSHSGYVVVRDHWVFRFFNSKAGPVLLRKFEGLVRGEFGLKPEDTLTGELVKKAIADKRRRLALKKYYKAAFGKKELNATTLLMFHGPISTVRGNHAEFFIDARFPSHSGPSCLVRKDGAPAGNFLTGDAEVKDTWKEIYRHFDREFPRMARILLPHHGSENNWTDNLIRATKGRPTFLVSAGIRNKYGHPDAGVVEEVIRTGCPLLWSHQFCKITEACRYS